LFSLVIPVVCHSRRESAFVFARHSLHLSFPKGICFCFRSSFPSLVIPARNLLLFSLVILSRIWLRISVAALPLRLPLFGHALSF